MSIMDTWRATFVRRWHSNPDMCHHTDMIGGHSERVALLLLGFWPDSSRDLIRAALMHDLHESVLGDPPPAGKARLRGAYETEAALVDAQNGWAVDLSPEEAARLQFADRLDAYLFARERGGTGIGWSTALTWLDYAAERMGIADRVKAEGLL